MSNGISLIVQHADTAAEEQSYSAPSLTFVWITQLLHIL